MRVLSRMLLVVTVAAVATPGAVGALLDGPILVVPLGTAHHDDAGTGTDAGGAPEHAMVLPGFGAWSGGLAPPRDVDWYRVDAPRAGPVCVDAQAFGTPDADVEVRIGTDEGTHLLPGDLNEAPRFQVTRVATSLDHVLFGVRATPNAAEKVPARPGPYDFGIEALGHDGLGPGDAATGEDAGEEPEDAFAAAPCVAGALTLDASDPRDLFSFHASAGEARTLTFALLDANATIYLNLVDPDGVVVAKLAHGEATTVALPSTGEYLLAVGGADATAGKGDLLPPLPTTVTTAASADGGVTDLFGYMLALDDEKPGQACRPSCLAS